MELALVILPASVVALLIILIIVFHFKQKLPLRDSSTKSIKRFYMKNLAGGSFNHSKRNAINDFIIDKDAEYYNYRIVDIAGLRSSVRLGSGRFYTQEEYDEIRNKVMNETIPEVF